MNDEDKIIAKLKEENDYLKSLLQIHNISFEKLKEIKQLVCLKDIHLDNVRIFGQGVRKFVQLNLYTAL